MSVVRKNLAALTVAQLIGYAIPILEIPILARTLGPEPYGELVLLQSIALICSLTIEFGFNLSASRKVALSKGDRKKIGRIASDVTLAKTIIFFACVVVFLSAIKINNFTLSDIRLLPLAILYVAALGFSPFWIYQGLEKMVFPLVVDLTIRTLSLCALFFYVKSSNDLVIAIGILTLSGLVNTAVTSFYSIKFFDFQRFQIFGALNQIKDGVFVFVYKSANTILLTSAPSVIAFASGSIQVANYIPAEKFLKGFVGLASPLITALFPYISRSFSVDVKKSAKISWSVVWIVIVLGAICSLTVALFAENIIFVVLGQKFSSAVQVLQILIWLVPIRVGGQVVGLLLLIPLQKEKIASFWLSTLTVVAVAVGGVLSFHLGSAGMAIGLLVAETALLICLIGVARKATKNALENELRN